MSNTSDILKVALNRFTDPVEFSRHLTSRYLAHDEQGRADFAAVLIAEIAAREVLSRAERRSFGNGEVA